MRLRTAGAAAILSLAISGVGAAVAVPAVADTPTVSVDPNTSLADGQQVTVLASGFNPGDTVAVVQCTTAAASGGQADCDVAHAVTGTVGADGTLTINTVAETWNYSDSMGGTCPAGSQSQCLIAASDINGAGAGAQAFQLISFSPAPALGANPDSNLTNGESITADITGFTAAAGSGVFVAECDSQAVNFVSDPTTAEQYCDLSAYGTVPADANGNGTNTYTIVAGNSYSDNKGGKCDAQHACYLAATSDLNFTQVAFTPITFDQSVVTKTVTSTAIKVSGKLKAGKKDTVTVTTTPASSSLAGGVMTITDNGKVVKKTTETATGKVSTKVKLVKGKNKIKATYSGNANNLPSSAKKTVKAKKA